MSLIVYLDEAGDHSLERTDPSFPVFALVMFVCDTTDYAQKIVPAVYQLKIDFFGHEGVILHSRDIRKAQGDFGVLTDPVKRPIFYDRINGIMGNSPYKLIATVIRKQEHINRYGNLADNPYELSLRFSLERLLPCLEAANQDKVIIVAEGRGKNEDDALRLSFLETVTNGTTYISAERFRRVQFRLEFKPKSMNIIGTQLADLAAYPIAIHAANSLRKNPAYEVIKDKFYRGAGAVYGLKIFP